MGRYIIIYQDENVTIKTERWNYYNYLQDCNDSEELMRYEARIYVLNEKKYKRWEFIEKKMIRENIEFEESILKFELK
jgi:hypothetical protein